MPRRAVSSHHFRARFTAIAVVIGGHAVLFALLAETGDRDGRDSAEERMTLVFFDLPDKHPEIVPDPRAPAASRSFRALTATPPPAIPESSAITQPGIDWHDAASRAAAREATKPDVHDFGFPKRERESREKKEFGWDKTHTERVHALAGGGIGIHLSDNCELILIPLPLGGCSFGKRKARGDLFDEMKAPPSMGAWKEP